MKDFKTGYNPFLPENLTMFLIISIISSIFILTMILIDKLIIPRINPDNKFRKFWEKHIVATNPFEKN